MGDFGDFEGIFDNVPDVNIFNSSDPDAGSFGSAKVEYLTLTRSPRPNADPDPNLNRSPTPTPTPMPTPTPIPQ